MGGSNYNNNQNMNNNGYGQNGNNNNSNESNVKGSNGGNFHNTNQSNYNNQNGNNTTNYQNGTSLSQSYNAGNVKMPITIKEGNPRNTQDLPRLVGKVRMYNPTKGWGFILAEGLDE